MDLKLTKKFIRDLWNCCRNVPCIIICLMIFFVWGLCSANSVKDQKMVHHRGAHKTSVTLPDSMDVVKRIDKLLVLYDSLDSKVKDYDDIVKNYQSDANLVLEKGDEMVSKWLTISTAFVALIIGLSVWNNYKQENSYKESVTKLRRDLDKSLCINKIGSIMTCLNSIPNPLLTKSDAERRSYVYMNISLMFDEFSVYVRLVKEDAETIAQEGRYLQLVLSALRIGVIRAQDVYSDLASNVAFYTFTATLDSAIKDIHDVKVTSESMGDKLSNILSAFETFIMTLPR